MKDHQFTILAIAILFSPLAAYAITNNSIENTLK
jgi:hypothetical protein